MIEGDAIFRLMDTHGLPFETIQDELRYRGLAFDVLGFCQAAAESGNWRADRLERLLLSYAVGPESRSLVRLCISRAYVEDIRSG